MNCHEEERTRKIVCIMLLCLVILLGVMILLQGCTYNVSMVHMEGMAEDIIDNDQAADGKFDPTVTIPAKLI